MTDGSCFGEIQIQLFHPTRLHLGTLAAVSRPLAPRACLMLAKTKYQRDPGLVTNPKKRERENYARLAA